jgi:uncharacterized protein YggE
MPPLRFVLLFSLTCSGLLGQASAQSAIQATGNATIYVKPDQAQLDVGVTTSGSTAQSAAQQNATATTAVISALTSALGSSGTIQTIGYSVYPNYTYPGPNQSPVLNGYTASNTIQVTTFDLSITGKLIDTANQAGANSVGGLTFGVQNPEPAKQQALTAAAKQALAHAAAIAAGLGAKTGAVLSAQEGATVAPIPVAAGAAAAGTTTPIQTGTVSVTATVTITVQLQ